MKKRGRIDRVTQGFPHTIGISRIDQRSFLLRMILHLSIIYDLFEHVNEGRCNENMGMTSPTLSIITINQL